MVIRPKELENACLKVGEKVPEWTQGAGGNISVKIVEKGESFLWIKASGVRLDEVPRSGGLACVRLSDFLSSASELPSSGDEAEKGYSDLLGATSVKAEGLGRPSMETGFHSLLKKKWVLHFHSLSSIIMTSRYFRNDRSWVGEVERVFGGKLHFLPALRPGWLLSQRLGEEGKNGCEAFLLQNHGLVLQGDSLSVLERWERAEERFTHLTGLLRFARNDKGDDMVGPLRLYFPDVAVFESRLRKVLKPLGNGNFQLMEEAWEKDRDMAEIWAAVQFLNQALPDLEEMPSLISSTVATLPTEEIRKALHRGAP
jgi:ribulose-5-phosphate 4-epimerase/fuculose-1-phosphate aldolase